MSLPDVISAVLLSMALFFFTAGTIGLLRLPDLHSRLHALTKADNVGLGLTVFAAMFQAEAWTTVFKLALIWLLVLAAGATVCFLIAERARLADAAAARRSSP
jgi:multicomponent Na+:H+ antiporter subunit G